MILIVLPINLLAQLVLVLKSKLNQFLTYFQNRRQKPLCGQVTPPLPSHLATNQRQPPRGGAGREGGYKSEKVAFDQPLLTKLPSPPEPKSFVVSALVRNDLMPI